MKIAVVGGGSRCKRLMEVIERHRFQEIDPRVIAVADVKTDAPGLVKARQQGLYVTEDYNDFFKRCDIDLIIELTDNMDIYNDILRKKSPTVRAICTRTAQLFWEISRISTKQRKCTQQLHETQVMYSTFINELIQDDVLVIGRDYLIIDANDSIIKKMGHTREEIIGRPCYEITHRRGSPCSGDQHPCPLVETINTEKPSQMTHVHQTKNNREICYSISTYPLIEQGKVIGAIEVSRDITKDINLQKVMMQQEKLASIGRLSAGVAHEINNPLTTILTTAMLLKEDIEPENPMFPELETIANETLRCRKIVSSLLDFARQQKPKKGESEINRIISEIIVLINKQAIFRDINLELDLAADLPLIQVDRGQIQQALINLALNGIEATGAGGKVCFASRYLSQEKLVEVSVSDTGSGIAADIIDNIIDPFFTTKEEGTGLGLAIVHGIIEQHDGSLEIISESGQGARFVIRLPVSSGD
jgi:PAS domain S-box-containing protein